MSTPALFDLVSARALVAGIELSSQQVEQLAAYYALLERWNQKINLTALPLEARAPATVDRLLIESLIAARHVADVPLKWFDFGSGGGSPAIPIKLMRPKTTLVMIEAKERKSAFLREAVSSLGLQTTSVLTGRIEEIDTSSTKRTVDLVTVRAVRLDPEVLGAARDVLKLHGQLMLFRGSEGGSAAQVGFEADAETSLAPSTGILSIFRRVNG